VPWPRAAKRFSFDDDRRRQKVYFTGNHHCLKQKQPDRDNLYCKYNKREKL